MLIHIVGRLEEVLPERVSANGRFRKVKFRVREVPEGVAPNILELLVSHDVKKGWGDRTKDLEKFGVGEEIECDVLLVGHVRLNARREKFHTMGLRVCSPITRHLPEVDLLPGVDKEGGV